MVHDTDKILTRRASLAVVGGLVLLPLVEAAQAAEQANAQQIVKGLQVLTSEQEVLKKIREITPRSLAEINDEQNFLEEMRRRPPSRSFTPPERRRLIDMSLDKPGIDLEINFDFDSAAITPKARPLAVELGLALVDPQLKGVVCLVGGHTDGRGSDAYNLDLSQRRAEAIKAFLAETYRIPAQNLIAVGYGKEHLKNPGNPFAEENRRVQVVNMLKPE
jgi:outer membrane protein OmpA-like peptidoglycan-associated protein